MPAIACPVQELQSKSTHESATYVCDAQRRQPWKAHWPPKEIKAAEGVEYGAKKGAVIVVDGTSARVAPPRKENGKEDTPRGAI